MRQVISLSFLLAVAAFAQQPSALVRPLDARCASCHGADGNGNTRGPSIIGYLRYHTDAEVSEGIRQGRADKGMPSFQLSPDEMRELLADARTLTGTKPEMATGGFTGSRAGGRGAAVGAGGRGGGGAGGGGRGGRGGIGAPAAAAPSGPVVGAQVSLKLASGGTIEGKLLGLSEFDAQLRTADGKIHLLARDGDLFRDKPIEPKRDWVTYHGDLSGNRYSSLEQINSGNVQRMAPAWIFPVPSSPRLETTPVVADGVMYLTGWNELYALDATTGHQIWSYRQPHTEGILSEGGSGANRGAAVAGDLVFLTTDSAHLIAFNRFDGAKLWDVEMASYKESYSATSPPLVVGDLLIQGVAGGEEGARGFIDAYKASTGERVWRFYSIPKRGEKGSETWIGNALEHGCGATWLIGSYDPTLDLIYWAIGNPCPDYSGDERKGDNLYTSSVVALAAKTGELKWHYQFTPHDTHDWDAVEPMVLVDEPWRGRPRKLLVHGDRNGYFFVLDRINGELLLATPLVSKVTWTTGYGKDGRPILTSTFDSTPEGVAICPGSGGGANWPDVSYSLLTKLFYVRVSDSCGIYTSSIDPLGNPNGTRWFGSALPQEKARQDLAALQAGYPAASFIRAVDIFTGKKVWDYPVTGGRTGVLSTAGGLAFVGASGGLVALDAKTGKPVWHIDIGQSSSASAMTYMVGGKQYLVLPGTGVIVAYALTN
jgi:alcohol dehydrogenase (cytochrome c)